MKNTLHLRCEDLQVLDWRSFYQAVSDHIKCKNRTLTFFATPSAAGATSHYLNAAFLNREAGLVLIRTEIAAGGSFPSFTNDHPEFHCFEREIFETAGIKPSGHPWLKPLRYSGIGAGQAATYPFFKIDGKEVHEVGVGPVHAGIIEPGHFRFMCLGETIHHLEIQLGYQHRGLEQLLLGRRPETLGPMLEIAAGDTTLAHAWAYCNAVESASQSSLTPEAQTIRGLGLELERIAMHLSSLAGLSNDIAFLPGGSTYGRLRTTIINTSMLICGSRFGRAWFRPGGVLYGLSEVLNDLVRNALLGFQKDLALINDLFLSSPLVNHRLKGTGCVAFSLAQEIGLVGHAARSSGHAVDIRHEIPSAPYNFSSPIETEIDGDCWSRASLRIAETEASTSWILSVLKNDLILEAPPLLKPKIEPNSISISTIEGWRGEVVHYLETDSMGLVRHYHIQDPSLRNWFGLALAVRENPISDFPVCNKSFDLSYCGHDL